LGYWVGAKMAARGLRSEADSLQGNAIAQLNYRILTTQWAIDQKEKLLKMERRMEKEPGGIKLNERAIDELISSLDIESIGYDPIQRIVVLSGRRSRYAIDMDIFSTVFRLALEHDEPFFSLNSVNIKDWDSMPNRV